MILDFLFTYFDYPLVLLAPPLIIILLFFTTFKDFVQIKKETPEEHAKRRHLKLFVLVTRILIFTLLLIALAAPFKEVTKEIQGTPRIKLLIDNSTSMTLFSQTLPEKLKTQLEDQIPVEVAYLGKEESSPLGDGILSAVRKDDNILLLTDGHANEGTILGDAALYAASINVTLNAIKLDPEKYDAAIRIIGPEKVTTHSENDFTITLSQTHKKPVRITVSLDGNTLFDEATDKEIPLKQAFTEGYHTLKATIQERDSFTINNEYYKTIKVVPRPKVFLFSKEPTPLSTLYNPVYDLTTGTNLPDSLKPYTALIFNDIPAAEADQHIEALTNHIIDGNGLFVVGGENSYDIGGYKGSRFEHLLPVIIAQAGKKRGEVSIVVVIDVSGSTGTLFGEGKAVDVEKALVLSILQDLSPIHRVGAVAFNTESYVVGEVKPLIEHLDLEDKLSRLQDSGGTYIGVGMLKAIELLQHQRGSKNIILVTDGKTQNADQADDAVRLASSQGIKTYVVGVGQGTNENYMRAYAELGGGAFFQPDSKDTLKILFGDPETSGNRRAIPYVYIDENHFISKGLKPLGLIYGYNLVVPKTSARLIATNDVGDPLLVVSRFGLGRIASLATDDGDLYAPELLTKENSRIYTRTANWVIGDPERNNEKYIHISDTRIQQPAEIIIKSQKQPTYQDITFRKIDENLWTGSTLQETTGFHTLGEATYAVNYPAEYEYVGQDEGLEKTLATTGGKLFDKNDIQGIIEHVRERSRRYVLEKESYAWIFALAAMTLFLLEVAVRRIIRNFYK